MPITRRREIVVDSPVANFDSKWEWIGTAMPKHGEGSRLLLGNRDVEDAVERAGRMGRAGVREH